MTDKYIVLHWLQKKDEQYPSLNGFSFDIQSKAYATIEEATEAAEALKKAVDPCISDDTIMKYVIKNIWF